jgi:hypothetical protein
MPQFPTQERVLEIRKILTMEMKARISSCHFLSFLMTTLEVVPAPAAVVTFAIFAVLAVAVAAAVTLPGFKKLKNI